jgi:hypothetical protein
MMPAREGSKNPLPQEFDTMRTTAVATAKNGVFSVSNAQPMPPARTHDALQVSGRTASGDSDLMTHSRLLAHVLAQQDRYNGTTPQPRPRCNTGATTPATVPPSEAKEPTEVKESLSPQLLKDIPTVSYTGMLQAWTTSVVLALPTIPVPEVIIEWAPAKGKTNRVDATNENSLET